MFCHCVFSCKSLKMICCHQQTFTPELVGDQQGMVRFKQRISLPNETFRSVSKTDQPANGHNFHQPDALTTSEVTPSYSILNLKQTFLLYRRGDLGGLSIIISIRIRNAYLASFSLEVSIPSCFLSWGIGKAVSCVWIEFGEMQC